MVGHMGRFLLVGQVPGWVCLQQVEPHGIGLALPGCGENRVVHFFCDIIYSTPPFPPAGILADSSNFLGVVGTLQQM